MCGICGLVARGGLSPEDYEQVGRMNAALVHRGPDGAGEYRGAHLALAMRRLSIIDLKSGWQPLFNEDRTLAAVVNGEIYNFIELRERLEQGGHRFGTGSDGETILHLYEEHGADCVRHLRGMFAFALWDARRQRLMLARDRMGEKPLYLFERGGALLFASELKALLRSGAVPFALDPTAVDLYFHYSWVPEPATAVRGVRKLDAATVMLVDVDPWRVHETCYWRMEDAPQLAGDPVERIRAELREVSRLVIRSDVPVGVALSGGLDSGAVAALTAREYPDTMHAFSVGYPGRPPCDERPDAKALADRLGMPFHEVELDTAGMAAAFPEVVYWRDDPIADISGYGYYAVMKLAREHQVPVMLQGQGGDELFWGYSGVREALRRTMRLPRLREAGWRALAELIRERLPEALSTGSLYRWIRGGAGIPGAVAECRDLVRRPADRLCFWDVWPDFLDARSCIGRWYGPALRGVGQLHDVHAAFTIPQPLPPLDVLFTKLICATYLRGNGIAQGDRLSMASGVELRLPLLDYQLVETVIGLRKTTPDHQLQPKAWFKAALEGVLPAEVIDRPKRGFSPPVGEWYRALFGAYGGDLEGGYLVTHGILSPEGGRFMARGESVSGVVHPLSFKSLVLEQWCRRMSGSAA